MNWPLGLVCLSGGMLPPDTCIRISLRGNARSPPANMPIPPARDRFKPGSRAAIPCHPGHTMPKTLEDPVPCVCPQSCRCGRLIGASESLELAAQSNDSGNSTRDQQARIGRWAEPLPHGLTSEGSSRILADLGRRQDEPRVLGGAESHPRATGTEKVRGC